MDGSPFLPGDVCAEDVPLDLVVPDPGIHLGSGVYFRVRDLLMHLEDLYRGRIYNQLLKDRLYQELLGINQQLISYRTPWMLKWYFFPRHGELRIILHPTGVGVTFKENVR